MVENKILLDQDLDKVTQKETWSQESIWPSKPLPLKKKRTKLILAAKFWSILGVMFVLCHWQRPNKWLKKIFFSETWQALECFVWLAILSIGSVEEYSYHPVQKIL